MKNIFKKIHDFGFLPYRPEKFELDISQQITKSLNMETERQPDAINLSEIDWNKLSVSEFRSLSKKFEERDKLLKSQKVRKKRDNGEMRVIKIDNVPYQVKNTLVKKLKSMKSDKAKQKILDSIRKTHQPIENI